MTLHCTEEKIKGGAGMITKSEAAAIKRYYDEGKLWWKSDQWTGALHGSPGHL